MIVKVICTASRDGRPIPGFTTGSVEIDEKYRNAPDGTAECEGALDVIIAAFEVKYQLSIITITSEALPSEKEFLEHLEQVGELYEEGKDCLHAINMGLMNDPNYNRLFKIISDLRDKAAVALKAQYKVNETLNLKEKENAG